MSTLDLSSSSDDDKSVNMPYQQTKINMVGVKINMPTGPRPRAGSSTGRRRFSTNTLEGQRGTLRAEKETLVGDLTLRDRIHHFTLAWFTCTMSTGGIAMLLAETPHRFPGLETIGDIIFFFDLVLFLAFCGCLFSRFTMFPRTMAKCLSHPTESLFFPTFWISVCNILSNIQTYGVPRCGYWLVVTMRVLFWVYAVLTFCFAVGQYFFLFTGRPLTIQSMTPAWILPVFPVMLCGTLASLMGDSQPPQFAGPILVAGVTFQGLGMFIAVFMYGAYLRRLMTSGLPIPNTRPGMFIAVGPPSFTGLALITITESMSKIYPDHSSISYIQHPEVIADVFRLMSVAAGVFLWATALWFFCIAIVSVLHGACSKPGMSFHLVWWSFVFPNVGFTICTIDIGKALNSEGILWLGTVMTVILVITWLSVGFMHARAVVRKDILWPGKDEDHDQ